MTEEFKKLLVKRFEIYLEQNYAAEAKIFRAEVMKIVKGVLYGKE